MYAIRSRITKQWLYGTDYREWQYIQRLSVMQALTYETKEMAELDMEIRKCDNEFEIVKVELVKVGD